MAVAWDVLIPVIIYFIVLLVIGVYASRRVKSFRDYIIAVGQVSSFALLGTVIATQWGGVTVMGVPGLAYAGETYRAVYYASAAVPRFLVWALLLAYPIWLAKPWTVTEWFTQRFDRKCGYLAAILNILGFVGLIAGQLVAAARILSVITGIPFEFSLLMGAAIVIIYTVTAGLWGVIYTDIFQFIIIFAGILTLAGVVHATIGLDTLRANLPPTQWSTLGVDGALYFVTLFILWCADLPFNYVIQRISSAKTKRALFMAPIFGAISYLLAAYLGGLLGTAARYTLPKIPSADEAVIRLSVTLLPPTVAGFLCAALLAVTMSSADTYLNAPVALLTNDIVKPLKPTLTDRQLLALSRIVTLALSVIAIIMGLWLRGIITVLVTFLYFTIALIPAFIASVTWRRASPTAAFWSMLIGGVVGAGLRFAAIYGFTPPGLLYGMYIPAFLAIAISSVLLIAISFAKPMQVKSSTLAGGTKPDVYRIARLMPW
ncbi:MAG: sodium:solute symporter family protein [Ignisphaera sp.]|uniref:Sodium:solute symporter family protein n=1 Tax=Ignisphaera aggregans TaxID=334771 RepID=A0A7J3JPP7_9CREN